MSGVFDRRFGVDESEDEEDSDAERLSDDDEVTEDSDAERLSDDDEVTEDNDVEREIFFDRDAEGERERLRGEERATDVFLID